MTDKQEAFTLDLSLQVGKYDIQKLLGKGATGTVYLATDTFSGREVALKTISSTPFAKASFTATSSRRTSWWCRART